MDPALTMKTTMQPKALPGSVSLTQIRISPEDFKNAPQRTAYKTKHETA